MFCKYVFFLHYILPACAIYVFNSSRPPKRPPSHAICGPKHSVILERYGPQMFYYVGSRFTAGGVEKNNPKTEAEGQETAQKNPVIFYHLVRTAEAVAVGEDTSQLSLDKRWDLSPSVLLSSGFQSGGCHTPPGGHQKLKKIRIKIFVVLNSLICRILLLLNC